MELRYGFISDERCKEINSWTIRDPYGYGEIYTAEREYFVTNEDETILFCHAFMPRHDDREGNHETYLYINKDEYHFVNYVQFDFRDEERFGEMHRIGKINILENDFIQKTLNKDEVLKILKALIAKNVENSVCLPNFKRIYEFTFYYSGEEI